MKVEVKAQPTLVEWKRFHFLCESEHTHRSDASTLILKKIALDLKTLDKLEKK